MKVSLIMATVGRSDELHEFLESLERQTFRDFEVIVVDQNGPSSPVPPLLEGRAFPIRRLVTPCGASRARNAGLSAARGEIVAFPDDDCTYEPDTLARVVGFFSDNPAYGALVGQWKPCRDEEISRFSVFRRAGTCFFFLRRTWTDRIGGFDEDWGPGPDATYPGGEDTDYLLRGLEQGMRIRRVPAVVIHHPDLPVEGAALQKVRAYGRARMALLKKHRLPFAFRLANVVYPLLGLLRHPRNAAYWWNMFIGRLVGFLI